MADTSVSEQIARYLTAMGLTPAQVAGVTGNLKIESNYNTSALNQDEGAIGIAQWRLGRRTALQAYAASIGRKETDLAAQLGFLWHELTSDSANGLAQLRAATTPAQAATVFDQYFERSDGKARPARIAAAQDIYKTVSRSDWINSRPGGPTLTDGPLMTTSNPSTAGSGSGAWAATPAGIDWGSPFDILPGGPLIRAGIEGATGDTGIDIASRIVNPILEFAAKATFIIAGIIVVGIGLAQTVKPAADKAKDAALTVINTAKTAKP